MDNSDSFERASANIGSYMLQGWILTDEQCHQPNCPTPLLRSKDGTQMICVAHDLPATATATSQHQAIPRNNKEPSAKYGKPAYNYNEEQPTFETDEDEEAEKFIQRVKERNNDVESIANKRREQSNRASQLIGQKLLQQWALVNDVCPNDTCYAVPLVRDLQQRLYCVICEHTYMTENAYLKSLKKQEDGSDVVMSGHIESNSTPAKANASQTITQDINLRDLDIDLDDPEFLTNQLQMLKKNSQTKVASTSTSAIAANKEIIAPQSPSGSLLNQLKRKVDSLSQDAIATQDPSALVKLFEAIKAGSEAIEAYQRIC
ncbi:hypothetical protein Unana1_05133 [Umbelopsis nana]